MQGTISIDSFLRTDEDSPSNSYDIIRDVNVALPDKEAILNDNSRFIEKVMEVLDEREKYIVAQRFGLCDGETRTLDRLGEDLGVTRERVRQLEKRALGKLKVEIEELEL